MQGFWRVTIKYVNITVIYTLNKIVHSRTWSNIIVKDGYKCKKWAVCGMWSTNITARRLKL